ncbi:MAG: TPR end-of-group domain-containing protein [Terracidiphilus sp.]
MPALNLIGRISAISLLVALPAAPHAQPAVAAPQPSQSSVAATASANAPFGAAVQAPPPAPTVEQRGDFLIVHQRYQAALDAYSSVEQPSASLWNKMGIAYHMLFESKNAARCYKESLKLDPEYPGALNNLATIDDANRDFSAAERLYRRALKVNPNSARILKNLGTNLMMQHRYSESSDAYAQALALDLHIFDGHLGPTTETQVSIKVRGEASYLSARSCARAGLTDCAIEHLRQAFDEGFATKKQVANDNDFEALRQTPEFERLLAEQQ